MKFEKSVGKTYSGAGTAAEYVKRRSLKGKEGFSS
jgi:hypothetical protein